jgi:hypothetical protein
MIFPVQTINTFLGFAIGIEVGPMVWEGLTTGPDVEERGESGRDMMDDRRKKKRDSMVLCSKTHVSAIFGYHIQHFNPKWGAPGR